MSYQSLSAAYDGDQGSQMPFVRSDIFEGLALISRTFRREGVIGGDGC